MLVIQICDTQQQNVIESDGPDLLPGLQTIPMTLAGESEEQQRPLAAGPEPVVVCPTTEQPRGPSRAEDDLQHLGTEAIEQLACGLNKAAITIQEFGHNVSCLDEFNITKKS